MPIGPAALFYQFLSPLMALVAAGQQQRGEEAARRENIRRYQNILGGKEGDVLGSLGLPGGPGGMIGAFQKYLSEVGRHHGESSQNIQNFMDSAMTEYLLATQRGADSLRAGWDEAISAYQSMIDRVAEGDREAEANIRAMEDALGPQLTSALRQITALRGERYQKALEDFDRRSAELVGELEGLGEQEKKDILQQYGDLASRMRGQLAEAGLAGTTVMPTMEAGLQRRKSDELGRFQERIRRERLGLKERLFGKRTDIENMLAEAMLSAQTAEQMEPYLLQKELTGTRTGRILSGRDKMSGLLGNLAGLMGQRGTTLGGYMADRYGGEADLRRLLGDYNLQNDRFWRMTGLSAHQSWPMAMLGFSERRSDVYPDPGLLSSAASNLGLASGRWMMSRYDQPSF